MAKITTIILYRTARRGKTCYRQIRVVITSCVPDVTQYKGLRTHFKIKIPASQSKINHYQTVKNEQYSSLDMDILWQNVYTWPWAKTNMLSRKMTHFCAVCSSLSRSLSVGYSSITDSSATKEKNIPSIIIIEASC